jgi:hypothetical protein
VYLANNAPDEQQLEDVNKNPESYDSGFLFDSEVLRGNITPLTHISFSLSMRGFLLKMFSNSSIAPP